MTGCDVAGCDVVDGVALADAFVSVDGVVVVVSVVAYTADNGCAVIKTAAIIIGSAAFWANRKVLSIPAPPLISCIDSRYWNKFFGAGRMTDWVGLPASALIYKPLTLKS